MLYLKRKQMELNLISKKNLWPRLIKNYFHMLFLRRERLKTVSISLGYDCQCVCVHCSAAKLKNKERKPVDLGCLKKTVDESVKLGAIHFNITGGEPLLYEESFDLIEYISKYKSSIISLATNGILLTLDMADRLKSVGVDVVQISLDSDIEEIHDQQRGFKGAYQKVIQGVENAKKSGLLVFLSAVVTRENLLNGGIDGLALMAKELGVILHLNSACSVGKWEGEYFYLNAEAKAKLNSILKLPYVRENTEAGYFNKGCKAAKEKIYISAYGDVLPCPFIQFSFGNIKDESLKDIWHKMRKAPCFSVASRECLASQSHEFISQYLKPLNELKQSPYPYELLKRYSK